MSDKPSNPAAHAHGILGSRGCFRTLGIILGMSILVTLAYFLWGRRAIESTLEREDIQLMIARNTARKMKGKVGFLPFDWNGLSVSCEGMICKTEPPRSLTELRVHQIKADGALSEVLQGKWLIRELCAEHIEAAFGAAASKHLTTPFKEPPTLEPPAEKEPLLKTEIQKLVIARADVLWGKSEENLGRLLNVSTEITHSGDNFQAVGHGGTFQQSGWPQAQVTYLRMLDSSHSLEIQEAVLTLGHESEIHATGLFEFVENPSLNLKLRFEKCPTHAFLSEELRSKFEATFVSDTQVTQQLKEKAHAQVKGRIRFTSALLHDVPALNRVAEFTEKKQFRQLKFNQLEGDFSWDGAKLEATEFELEVTGLLRVEGRFTVKEGALQARLQLGVSGEVLTSFPGAREEVFKEKRGAFFWTPLKLSGSLKHPEDDLKPRLIAAAEAFYAKKLLAVILNPGKDVIEVLKFLW